MYSLDINSATPNEAAGDSGRRFTAGIWIFGLIAAYVAICLLTWPQDTLHRLAIFPILAAIDHFRQPLRRALRSIDSMDWARKLLISVCVAIILARLGIIAYRLYQPI